MNRHQCDLCALDFLNRGALYMHSKWTHGIILEPAPRAKRPNRAKGASQAALSGFARVQQIAVRGKNANSADLWSMLGEKMFPKRGAA